MTFQCTDKQCPVVVDGEQVGVASRVFVGQPVDQLVTQDTPFVAAIKDKIEVGDVVRTAVNGGVQFEADVRIPAQKTADTIEISVPTDDAASNHNATVFVFENVKIEPWEIEIGDATVSGMIGVGSKTIRYEDE